VGWSWIRFNFLIAFAVDSATANEDEDQFEYLDETLAIRRNRFRALIPLFCFLVFFYLLLVKLVWRQYSMYLVMSHAVTCNIIIMNNSFLF